MNEISKLRDMVDRLCAKTDQEVALAVREAEQGVLARRAAKNTILSNATVFQVADALKTLIENRETELLNATRRALKTISLEPRLEAFESVAAFIKIDLQRYYDRGTASISHVVEIINYGDGPPPTLADHRSKLTKRIEAEIEIAVKETGASRNQSRSDESSAQVKAGDIFVVHGRNEKLRKAVADLVKQAGLSPIILHEVPNRGRTIIEKFIASSDVNFAIVILSGDDVGRLRTDQAEPLELRARQNVILELGFFLGKLKRENVCALYEEGVTVPSDFDGVAYVLLDKEAQWRVELLRELQAAGLITAEKAQEVLSPQLVIHSAIYFYGENKFDVTEAVRSRVVNGRLEVASGNHLGGDPCVGVGKTLELEYSLRGQKYKRAIPEGGVIQIQ